MDINIVELDEQIELATRVLGRVTSHPEEHNQETWVSICGSQKCIAGWTMHYAGYKLLSVPQVAPTLVQRPEGEVWEEWFDDEFIENACPLLGLTFDEAHDLFYDHDNGEAVGKLREHVNALIARRAEYSSNPEGDEAG